MQDMLTFYLGYLHKPAFFYPCLFVLGLMVGSLLNVVIYRLPLMLEREWYQQSIEFLMGLKNEGRDGFKQFASSDQTVTIDIVSHEHAQSAPAFNLFWPPSHCPECKHAISFWENIPLLSYLYLQGQCHKCHTHIPIRYFAIELFTALLSLVVGYVFGISLQLPFALLFTYSLIALTFIDIDKQILPDNITLLGLWFGLILSIKSVFVTPAEAILGAAGGYVTFWVIYWAFKLLTHKEGMGYGDFKLLAFAGAWLGWKHLPIVIFIASVTGTIYGLTCLIMRLSEKEQPIPFGPFLALGIWLTFTMGDQIVNTYLRWAY